MIVALKAIKWCIKDFKMTTTDCNFIHFNILYPLLQTFILLTNLHGYTVSYKIIKMNYTPKINQSNKKTNQWSIVVAS